MKLKHLAHGLLFILQLLVISPAFAKNITLTPSVYKKLERAQKALQNNQYQSVLDLLLPITKKTKKNSLNQAMSWQLIGHAYASQNNTLKAIEAYESALTQNTLQDSLKKPIVINLGQLYIGEKKYQKGIALLKQLLESEKANSDNANIHILVANGYYELNQFTAAIPHVQRAIEFNKSDKESWHQLLVSLYFELKKFEHAAKQLEKTILIFPDKKLYWKQLASIYMQLSEDKKALKILQLAWQKDLLTEEQDILDLSNLYALQDLPFEAALVLQTGLDNKTIVSNFKLWDRLSRLYLLAKEQNRAIKAMEKAITFSNKADDYLTLARIYMADEQWFNAQKILEMALTKQPSNPSEIKYFYAIVLFEQGENKKSRQLFSDLLTDKKLITKVEPWMTYVTND